MADTNKRKLKVKWYDALNPLKIAGGALNVYKQEIKKKRAKNNTNNKTNNTKTNNTKTNNNVTVKSYNKTDYNVATESGKKAYEAAIAKNKDKPKKKRLTAREKLRAKNVARHGKSHIDKLRAKNADFKKMRRKEMSKADFIKKYPKSITAQRSKGLRK